MNEQEALAQGLTIFTPRERKERAYPELNCQELTIAILFKAGRSYREICHFLKISERQVRYCVARVIVKYPTLKRG